MGHLIPAAKVRKDLDKNTKRALLKTFQGPTEENYFSVLQVMKSSNHGFNSINSVRNLLHFVV